MHELYVTQCILDSARRALPAEARGEDVREILVCVGRLDAIVSESLLFLFDAVKESRGFPHATLRIDIDPILCRCRRCSAHFGVPDAISFVCPECRSKDVEVLAGRGIRIMEMAIEDSLEV